MQAHQVHQRMFNDFHPAQDPWDCYIHLYTFGEISIENVGKYTIDWTLILSYGMFLGHHRFPWRLTRGRTWPEFFKESIWERFPFKQWNIFRGLCYITYILIGTMMKHYKDHVMGSCNFWVWCSLLWENLQARRDDSACLGVGLYRVFSCLPLFGDMIQVDQYFSDRLKPPTSGFKLLKATTCLISAVEATI